MVVRCRITADEMQLYRRHNDIL